MKLGGSWGPKDCQAEQKVAIVIPYRDRENHLKLFLANLIPFLKKQRRAFTIFIVNQVSLALKLMFFSNKSEF